MQSVVCKALVAGKSTSQFGPGSAGLTLVGVWHGSRDAQVASENAIFGEATPAFSLSMAIANPEAAAFFEMRDELYVTFSKERIDGATPRDTSVEEGLYKQLAEAQALVEQTRDANATQVQQAVEAAKAGLKGEHDVLINEVADLNGQLATKTGDVVRLKALVEAMLSQLEAGVNPTPETIVSWKAQIG